jgi:RNA polymerase sigma-70 factor (ECF subfamily)
MENEPMESNTLVRETVEAVARRSHSGLVARLTARTRDAVEAEDALASAFLAALVDWPASGVPRNPEAWLLTVAKRKWIDATRRRRHADESTGHLRLLAEEITAEASSPESLPREHPALMLVCANDALDPGMRAPLLLQTLLGFEAADLGRVFRVSRAAMSQRLVRAKKRLREAGPVPHAAEGPELAARIDAVLEAIRAVAEAA